MDKVKNKTKERRGKNMKISEAKRLSPKEFAELDAAYGGFGTETAKNHPAREADETFMDFLMKGSEKIKSDPAVKKILS